MFLPNSLFTSYVVQVVKLEEQSEEEFIHLSKMTSVSQCRRKRFEVLVRMSQWKAYRVFEMSQKNLPLLWCCLKLVVMHRDDLSLHAVFSYFLQAGWYVRKKCRVINLMNSFFTIQFSRNLAIFAMSDYIVYAHKGKKNPDIFHN